MHSFLQVLLKLIARCNLEVLWSEELCSTFAAHLWDVLHNSSGLPTRLPWPMGARGVCVLIACQISPGNQVFLFILATAILPGRVLR